MLASMPVTVSLPSGLPALSAMACGRTVSFPDLNCPSSTSVRSATQTPTIRKSSVPAASAWVRPPLAIFRSAPSVEGRLTPALRMDIATQPPRNSVSSLVAPTPPPRPRPSESSCVSRPFSRSFRAGSALSPFLSSRALSWPSFSCNSLAESAKAVARASLSSSDSSPFTSSAPPLASSTTTSSTTTSASCAEACRINAGERARADRSSASRRDGAML
mmetsp:Transcript_1008/g.2847  ORF Transcript_1008/g.2847 Transcript_1008/m.2847 type:complete len:218 (-) Transcript_1008:82-735(-)